MLSGETGCEQAGSARPDPPRVLGQLTPAMATALLKALAKPRRTEASGSPTLLSKDVSKNKDAGGPQL